MRKVNKAAFTGFLLCFMAILYGVATNGGIKAVLNLLHFPSFMVTFGGALFAVMTTSDSFADFFEGLGSIFTAFKKQETSVQSYSEKILQYADIARKEGLLVLESEAQNVEDPFLKKGIMLAVDGSDAELVKDILETEMLHKEDRNKRNIRFWQDLGAYAPAWGMVGTLLGLINMMRLIGNDTSAIGAGMSLALITTLYGSILSNWICIPIARKLEKSNEAEILIMEVCIEGVLSVLAGDNPRVVKEKMQAIIEIDVQSKAA